MSEARLRALRMVGFKSFAEKTVVEFGPGISAVVGPNGSGKSNLADALRWALGEQGRSLRTRRAEDLIFAGSSSRRAIGMADVTLVIDNRDRLLPVDYAEVELGRRLFRSGENEYLLNRQRIRLRDLVDLLDEANLADNAFLFIGQGMVDQALALRPEERRPLFEEAAGIRKHERRRRAAEAELAEAETNVERVRDVLAELRPQARRLSAQAEQQEQRRNAGSELAEALVAAGRARLVAAERDAERNRSATAAARTEADAALGTLRESEEAARALTRDLAERSDAERGIRSRLDAARAATLEQRLAETRIATESQGIARDRARLDGDRTTLAASVLDARRAAASPVPEVDAVAESALRDAERALEAAVAEMESVRAGDEAEEARRTRILEARRAQREELARARDRHTELARRLEEVERTAGTADAKGSEARQAADAASAQARDAASEEGRAESAAEAARAAASAAEAELADLAARHAAATADLAALDARIEGLQQLLVGAVDVEAYRSARRRGGQPIAEGLDVEPGLRLAVEAALGDALRGLAVDAAAALALRDRRATLLLPEAPGRGARSPDRDASRIAALVADAGGGPLSSAIRRDPGGHVTRLLARSLWVPDLEAALDLRSQLPPGWRLATRDGELVSDEGVVRVGPAASQLVRQDALQALQGERPRAAEGLESVATSLAAADAARAASVGVMDEARLRLDSARRARRVADEAERSAARTAESAAREGAWQTAVLERLREQVAAATADLARAEAAERASGPSSAAGAADSAVGGGARGAAKGAGFGADGGGIPETHAAELRRLEGRATETRAVRDQRAAALGEQQRRWAAADERRRRAEIGAAMDERRLAGVEAELERIAGAEADLAAQRERVASMLAAAAAEEQSLTLELETLLDAGRDQRARLASAEAAAASARERLRTAEARGRTAEVAEMEARLHVDSARESLLVELAGIGVVGLSALLVSAGGGVDAPGEAEAGADAGAGRGTGRVASGETAPFADVTSADDLAPALEGALQTALAAWRSDPETEAPSQGRLTTLRRRYHELGASNPFAAEEYAEIRDRLETLDAQRNDLETAIRNTRELIGNLNTLIAEQFRRTFSQLEGAFARRFNQLFDGGEAQLTLTAPEDLSTTGVEITARPPGKKRQPLAMLSGGERALTAVALLLAMLEVRPVPFCVLDEVDAALDEANVGRFSAALRGLAETIQFVVITHNRGTIEAADALYGVTVGDDAVSRVVSMRLDGRLPRPGRNGHAADTENAGIVAVGPAS